MKDFFVKIFDFSSGSGGRPSIFALFHQTLFWCMLSLMSLGTVFVYSASAIYAGQVYGDQLFLFKKHLLSLLLGLFVWLISFSFPWPFLRRLGIWGFGVCSFLLFFTLMPSPFRHKVGGASRWLSLGHWTLQPGEFLKVFALFFFHKLFMKKWHWFSLLWLFLFFTGFLLQPDFGSFAIFLFLLLVGLFVRAQDLFFFWSGLLTSIGLLAFLVFRFPYRLSRVQAFWDPFSDPRGKGFQILQSLMAFSQGGWIGQGIGNSDQKLFFLPEAHNDFILAVIAEEMGLVGVFLIWSLFALIFLVLFFSLLNVSKDFFWFLFFVFAFFFLEVFFHFSVVVGAVPPKGLPLPFISFGGSSLIAHCFLFGALSSLLRWSEKDVRPVF